MKVKTLDRKLRKAKALVARLEAAKAEVMARFDPQSDRAEELAQALASIFDGDEWEWNQVADFIVHEWLPVQSGRPS